MRIASLKNKRSIAKNMEKGFCFTLTHLYTIDGLRSKITICVSEIIHGMLNKGRSK